MLKPQIQLFGLTYFCLCGVGEKHRDGFFFSYRSPLLFIYNTTKCIKKQLIITNICSPVAFSPGAEYIVKIRTLHRYIQVWIICITLWATKSFRRFVSRFEPSHRCWNCRFHISMYLHKCQYNLIINRFFNIFKIYMSTYLYAFQCENGVKLA